ncbi:hypothetical protein B0T18DRAFT_388419 [Schizothecium vesticola]|uniref:C2H2-type domain-containing protein n=1 Tax=Schizothecium vesticola TaxID=314040 RepID=A0AA40KB61_9PEZI|nr:hypothetical protein B0T18DRAFT_388419 [Schizothecium vesticola]
MDQRSFQFRRNEQGSPFSLTDHSAPGGLPPGSPDSFAPEEFARSVDMDAFASFPLADHRSFGHFSQAMVLQESQRAGGAALTIHKFIKDTNSPWTPVKLGQGQVNYSDRCFTMPRGTTGPSEYDDSAYYSMVDPSVGDLPSVTDFSVLNDTGSTFDTRSIVGNLSDLQLHNAQSQSHERASAPPNRPPRDAWTQPRPLSQEPATLLCLECNSIVKTKAELNKHKSRHEKPHMCQEPGCSRKVGFGTPNDLLRHQQSVHRAEGIKYRCMEGSCETKPPKDWPRADNFKQHLKRMHQIDLGSDPDLSKYERRCTRVSASPGQSQAKLGMLSSSPWMGLDQSQSALPGLSDRETSFRQLEDRAMHVSQELQQLPGPQEREARQDHATPRTGFAEAHHGSHHLLDEERPLPLEMDDTILRGLADTQTHAEALTPATSDDSFSLEGGSICPAALTSTPARVSTQDDLGPYQRPDVANHKIQGSPRVQDPHISGQADMDHTGQDSVEFESQDAADEDDLCDTASEDDSADGLHAFSESTTSRDESTRHNQDEAKARREEPNGPYRAALPSSKDTTSAMDIDQASALVISLHEKGMLGKILSQLGYQKTKEDEEDKGPDEKSQNALSSYGREHCPDCEKTFKRPCELKKHRKRHEKPYACTQEDCDKKFGSKNDWKRHENSQHMQLEFWRCTDKASTSGGGRACAKVCHSRKTFTKHLMQAHGVTDAAALEKRCVDALNGRNFESLFWCGFCRQAIPFKQHDALALSERFDHIDAHFTGKGGKPKTDISEWKSLETEPRATFREIMGEAPEPEEPPPVPGKRPRDGGDADDDEDAAASGSRKRRFVKLGPKDALLWVCCDCGHYWSPAVTTQCLVGGGCSHSLCSRCKLVVQESSDMAKGS